MTVKDEVKLKMNVMGRGKVKVKGNVKVNLKEDEGDLKVNATVKVKIGANAI